MDLSALESMRTGKVSPPMAMGQMGLGRELSNLRADSIVPMESAPPASLFVGQLHFEFTTFVLYVAWQLAV